MGGADERDIDWLREDLAASQSLWKIVMFHHPVYKAVDMTRDDWRSEIYIDKWVPVMEESKVDLVLNGHQHVYMRTRPMLGGDTDGRGITYIMGVSNDKSYEASDYDYVAASYDEGPVYTVFTADGDSLAAVTYSQQGQEVDSFRLNKQNGTENTGIDLPELMRMWYDLIKNLILFRGM